MKIVTWNVNGIKTLLQFHPWNALKSHEAILKDLGADIACIQETKITRAQMDKTLACMTDYDSFFSFFRRSVKGIHGTAIFTKRSTCVPLNAEEGISSALVPAAVPTLKRIGGYPMSSDDDLSFSEMKDLDLEGRTTVCDLGLFVLINLYCPNETNDERLIFKNYFNQMVDKRVRGLIRAGREVMVVGDLNICHSPIDSAEADQRTKDQGLANFTDHPPRKWLNEFIGPDGPMIDITRRLHPTRAFMYTCWNTKIDARPSNYGTRLDYILVTPGLLPWVRDSDILPDVVGSDHCPVYVDLYDEIEIVGRGKVSLWDEMNPGQKRDDPPPDPPAFAARYYDEFSGKQRLLSNFFGKKVEGPPQSPPVASPAPRSLSTPSTSGAIARDTPVASTSKLAITAPSSSAPNGTLSVAPSSSAAKGKEKATLENEKVASGGQQSISSFFKPPPKPKLPAKKKRAKKDAALASPSTTASNTSQESTSSSVVDLTDESDERLGAMDPRDYETASSGSSAASASSAWSSLFAQKALPNCDGHGERSKAWTVNKPGINKGRRFYLCARPVGPGYDKGQAKLHVNPEFRCDFFQWETSVKRPAGMNLSASAAKKSKS